MKIRLHTYSREVGKEFLEEFYVRETKRGRMQRDRGIEERMWGVKW